MIERWMSDVLTGVQRLRPIADELGLTMAQLAISWVLQNRNIASPNTWCPADRSW